MTVLQTQAFPVLNSSATSFAAQALQSNTTNGSRLVVCLTFEASGVTGVAVSDNHNGSYTLDGDSGALTGNGGNGGGRIVFLSVPNTFAGAGLTISGSWTTGCNAIGSIYELSGNPSFNLTGTAKTGTTTLTALGFSITPSSTAFVVAGGLSYSPTGIAVDTGYTFPANSNSVVFPDGITLAYHTHEYNAAATGAQSLTMNGTGTGGASMFAAAYAAVSGVTPTVGSGAYSGTQSVLGTTIQPIMAKTREFFREAGSRLLTPSRRIILPARLANA